MVRIVCRADPLAVDLGGDARDQHRRGCPRHAQRVCPMLVDGNREAAFLRGRLQSQWGKNSQKTA